MSRFTSAGSTSKNSSISSLMLRTPVSPLTAASAAASCLRYFTRPVSVTLLSFAIASTPSGAVALATSALFAAVVSRASSR